MPVACMDSTQLPPGKAEEIRGMLWGKICPKPCRSDTGTLRVANSSWSLRALRIDRNLGSASIHRELVYTQSTCSRSAQMLAGMRFDGKDVIAKWAVPGSWQVRRSETRFSDGMVPSSAGRKWRGPRSPGDTFRAMLLLELTNTSTAKFQWIRPISPEPDGGLPGLSRRLI